MTAICFVCNLPILSHQVGLVWQGGNGWDDLVREQMEESTLRQRLGPGRRDSAAQITSISPPTEVQETSPPQSAAVVRRRRSSLAQLTDILREWGGSTTRSSLRGSKQAQLCRRETLADLAKSLPWGKNTVAETSVKKRRESSADSGIKSISTKRKDSSATAISEFRSDIARLWGSRRESTIENGSATAVARRGSGESRKSIKSRRNSNANSRRGSGESGQSRRDSVTSSSVVAPPKFQKQHSCRHHKRKASRADIEGKYYREEQRPSTSSTASDSIPFHVTTDTSTQALPPPTIITSSVTPPSASPNSISPILPSITPPPYDKQSTSAATSPVRTTPTSLVSTRRDSTTQVYQKNRRDSRSPDGRPRDSKKFPRLPRQSTAIDESLPPPSRRESQPTLSPDPGADDGSGRKARRDSLSPDSASCGRSRRDSRSRLSPDRSADRDISPVGRTRRGKLRRQSTSITGGYKITGAGPTPSRSPESSSTCSSRDPSPCTRASAPAPPPPSHAPAIRRQSTTEEILIARGFRRQSTTEEMIRCRNFRRQSSRSDECTRQRGRRDSCAQITDGTFATMTVETSSTFFDISTQTESQSTGWEPSAGERSSAERSNTFPQKRRLSPGKSFSSTVASPQRKFPLWIKNASRFSHGYYGDGPGGDGHTLIQSQGLFWGFEPFSKDFLKEPSFLYDNNHYHEECLRCNSCGLNLTGPNQKRARRFKNHILCDLHFADVALMECSDFMQQLRSFKPQSLGCAVARRKSSTTLIFPLPPQACSDLIQYKLKPTGSAYSFCLHTLRLNIKLVFKCLVFYLTVSRWGTVFCDRIQNTSSSDEFCEEFPHNLIPTPGYWIECSRQKINTDTIWDESESDREVHEEEDEEGEETDSGIPVEKAKNDEKEDEGVRGIDRSRNRDLCLLEDDEEDENTPPKKKTTIEEQWERNQGFELTSVEQETYEKYFYGTEHWNYFTNDEDLGPVILSIKQETINGRDQFRILVRAISYTIHGLIPASCVFADRYNREEVVRSLGKEVNINPPLTLGQLPDTPEELLKLDQVFIKSELKVGVLYVKEGQYTEEVILDNNENSPLFEEFLQILGDKVRLKGFDKYKGGLDTVHDLTGLYSVYTNWRSIEIMFHVSTQLPYEKHDPQKLQRKRHIGNDIVCVVFLEADNTSFSPSCIKSHFLHTFILIRTSPKIKRKPTRYEVSVVTRDEVGAFKPYLWEQSVFDKGPMFREWLLTKIVNGERASYSAPKFARMQERTRSQMLEDIVANLANHAETGQIPKPYRRGSWRPIGHMRPSSPLLDSVRDNFEDYDSLAKDFTRVFLNSESNISVNSNLFDVTFLVGQSKQKAKFIGVRAILGVRSRVFQEMLYGIQTGFGSPQVPVAELLARAVPTLHSPQKAKSSNFLQVPDIESPRPKSVPSSPMVKRAFSRLGTITAGWGRSIRKQHSQLSAEDKKKWSSSQDCSNKENKEKEKEKSNIPQLAVPRLSVCADAQKVDRAKLAQTEFTIIEFDPDTFRTLLDYLHTGSCPLTCTNIPGLICAAEHYDLPELLQACFHHAKQFLRIDVVCTMLCSLENYYWRYTSASELVNMILAFVETRAHQLFQAPDFLTLSESMVQMVMCRNLEVPEVRKFEAMLAWAKNKIKTKTSTKVDARLEFKCIMERLARDLKLYRISPQELIKIVLPSKAIKNERILETLMFQANSGMYRIQDSYIIECQQRLQKQESKLSEWESFDYGF